MKSTAGRGSDSTQGRWMRVGRLSGLASALVLLGSSAYTAISLTPRKVSHEIESPDPDARVTYVGFQTWASVIPAPDWSEYVFHEIRRSNGEWVKDGPFLRRDRAGFVHEQGSYRDGKREGDWTFWDAKGGVEQERSGVYVDDARVSGLEPGHDRPR